MTKLEIELPESAVLLAEPDRRNELEEFGFFHLTIPEAARLVAVDMWFSGEITGVDEPDDFGGDPNDSRLTELLSSHISSLGEKMRRSAQAGLLKADHVARDLDDNVVPDETYISYDQLVRWLDHRNYQVGDAMTEWLDLQLERVSGLAEEAKFYRTATARELKKISIDRFDMEIAIDGGHEPNGDLPAAYKLAVAEVNRLRLLLKEKEAGHSFRSDPPLTTRKRRTLLTIVAALCKEAGIDPQARGATKRVEIAVSELGAKIGPDTIKQILDEIPDAVESRSK